MKISIRLFANFSELLQKHTLEIELPTESTVGDLRAYLRITLPHIAALLDKTMIAVNRRYAEINQAINENDEIALIPPVGGGSPQDPLLRTCRITNEPLQIDKAYQLLENVQHGGIVLFAGTVRELTKDRQTIQLTYDAYVEMAVEQMRQIDREVKAQFPTANLLQWHRIGLLLPADIAVICAAASPHRDVAFQAARTLIERLKKEVAIWKKEEYADGEAIWQPNEV